MTTAQAPIALMSFARTCMFQLGDGQHQVERQPSCARVPHRTSSSRRSFLPSFLSESVLGGRAKDVTFLLLFVNPIREQAWARTPGRPPALPGGRERDHGGTGAADRPGANLRTTARTPDPRTPRRAPGDAGPPRFFAGVRSGRGHF